MYDGLLFVYNARLNFYKVLEDRNWRNIDRVSKIGWCNGEYKVDARCGSAKLSTFVKKKIMM